MSNLQTRPSGVPAPSRPRRRWLRRGLIGIAALLVVAVLAAAALYGYGRWRFGQITKVHVAAIANGRDHHREGSGGAPGVAPMNVLLVGSDTRAVPGNNAGKFGSSSQVAGQRADVIKILHIMPGSHRISALSIPRDMLVTPPGGHAPEKINATFNNGPQQLVQTIESMLDIHIDHYVLVNFASFEQVVRALGGVKLDFPYPARDALSGLHITRTGCQLLGPGQALALARSRHYYYYAHGTWNYDPTSDFGRIARQDVFLKAVVQRAAHIGLFHLGEANAFLSAVVGSLQIDDTWTFGEMVNLARQFHGFQPAGLQEYVLPTTILNNDGALGDVLLPARQADASIVRRFLGLSQPANSAPSAAGQSSATPAPSAAPVPQVPLPAPDHGAYNPTLCS